MLCWQTGSFDFRDKKYLFDLAVVQTRLEYPEISLGEFGTHCFRTDGVGGGSVSIMVSSGVAEQVFNLLVTESFDVVLA